VTSGTTADFIKGAGIQSLHLSISHDGGKAIAMVVAEGGA
jgi:phosphopantetheinyl transferase (holo-ACP synthase)